MKKNKHLDIRSKTTRWDIETRIGLNGKSGSDIIVTSPRKDIQGHIEDVKEMISLHVESLINKANSNE